MKFQFRSYPQLKIILAENVMGHENVFEVQEIGVHVLLRQISRFLFIAPNITRQALVQFWPLSVTQPSIWTPKANAREGAQLYNMAVKHDGNLRRLDCVWTLPRCLFLHILFNPVYVRHANVNSNQWETTYIVCCIDVSLFQAFG